MNMLALLQPIKDCLGKIALHQLNRIIVAMLAMTGRVTMLGIWCWAGDGGSYRTIRRFYTTAIRWVHVFWQLFRERLMLKNSVYILAGDECVVSKAGKKTYGSDYFFAGLQQKVIPSLSFSYYRWSALRNTAPTRSRSSKPFAVRKKSRRTETQTRPTQRDPEQTERRSGAQPQIATYSNHAQGPLVAYLSSSPTRLPWAVFMA